MWILFHKSDCTTGIKTKYPKLNETQKRFSHASSLRTNKILTKKQPSRFPQKEKAI